MPDVLIVVIIYLGIAAVLSIVAYLIFSYVHLKPKSRFCPHMVATQYYYGDEEVTCWHTSPPKNGRHEIIRSYIADGYLHVEEWEPLDDGFLGENRGMAPAFMRPTPPKPMKTIPTTPPLRSE